MMNDSVSHRSESAAAPSGSRNDPLSLLAQGKQQYIKVDYKKVLENVIIAMGVTVPPSYSEIDCGSEGVKYVVTLDLSCCNQSSATVVEGHPFTCKKTAEESVFMMAFLYLEENANVRLLDFSTRVSLSYSTNCAYQFLTEAFESAQQALARFDSCFGRCMDLALELEGGGMNTNIAYILSGHDTFYKGIREHIGSLVKDFSSQSAILRAKIAHFEDERSAHLIAILDKRKLFLAKRFSKEIVITSKFLLNHLLGQLGRKNAQYINGPDGCGKVDAEINFKLPAEKKLKHGGNIKICAKGSDWANAEENAAYEALLFIEDNFKATIVDLNFTDRLDAEKGQFKLSRMLHGILEVGVSVKEMWENFLKALSTRLEHISSESNYVTQANAGEDYIDAYKTCLHAFSRIHNQTANCYGTCCPMFVSLEDIATKMEDMKLAP